MKAAKAEYKRSGGESDKKKYDQRKNQLARLDEQLHKLEIAATDKEENAEIALGKFRQSVVLGCDIG